MRRSLLVPAVSSRRFGSLRRQAAITAIVEVHGGRIWLPATAEGTRVRFSIPLGDGTAL